MQSAPIGKKMINTQPPRQVPSLIKGNTALQLFTDRHNFIKLFAEYLNEDEQPHQKILFLTGDGGNGKSLLINFLKEKCCKRFPQEKWHELKTQSDEEVTEFIVNAPDFKPVPAVLLDFGKHPTGVSEERPQDPFYGLSMLYRRLLSTIQNHNYQLHFPLYEFACILYLKQNEKLTPEIMSQYFESSVKSAFISGIMTVIDDTVNSLPPPLITIISSILSQPIERLREHIDGNLTLRYLRGRALREDNFELLQDLDVDTELINELPRLFASDINVAMSKSNAPERVVLFFDSYEAFWKEQRNLSNILFFEKDRWLRHLLHEVLNLSNHRIVVVVAGREPPRWHEDRKLNISQEHIDSRQVLHLSTSDAKIYLKKVKNCLGSEDILHSQVSDKLIKIASVDNNQVHPFCLSLCADSLREVVKEGKDINLDNLGNIVKPTDKIRITVELILKYTDNNIKYAVDVLSACRAFNFEVYHRLGRELHFSSEQPDFDTLTKFPFVWKYEDRGQDWYCIHNLVRQLNHEDNNETTQKAHAKLENFYRDRNDVAEAIYHAICQDSQRGVSEWIIFFRLEMKRRNFEVCRILLALRKEMNF